MSATENALKPLYALVQEEIGKVTIRNTPVPPHVTENLNPALPLRPYQLTALKYFAAYWDNEFDGKPSANHQLLFHMATGSGKTMMMAALMLDLYARGYRKFLFFVNSTNIIEKTKRNFLSQGSPKYLFAESLAFGDKQVAVRQVENFQSISTDDINIVFTTIQGLHMALAAPKEGSVTYDDFEDDKIVLISDEAHHINVATKQQATALGQGELLEFESWESTVDRIFRAHADNVLLEFTATIDFEDASLAAKYVPRLLVDYPLRTFRQEGYSKEVRVLQSDVEPWTRALQAVLLSQYRRKLFEGRGIHIKPVVLFKSKTIPESREFFGRFTAGLKDLSGADVRALLKGANAPILQRASDYFSERGITPANLAAELKVDFSEDKLIVVNSKDESVEKQIAVNTLETNGYRAVFAVDKLNEGWDVLNLFDIVRLYDTRDTKGGKIGKTTTSEAQLIGRGARYCPFQLSEDQPLFLRKYDSDVTHEMRVCEELYYHSAYNPKYIQELNKALREIGIAPDEARERALNLKEAFTKTDLYKKGYLFVNERERQTRVEVASLSPAITNHVYRFALRTGYSRTDIAFEAVLEQEGAPTKARDYMLASFGVDVLRTAMQRLEFFAFDNLKRHLPNLKSAREFITSDAYLASIKVEVSGAAEAVNNLSPTQRLAIAVDVLERVAAAMSAEAVEFKGGKRFIPRAVKDVFVNKVMLFAKDQGGDREFGRSMSNALETAIHLDLGNRKWYAYEDSYGTAEEKLLIRYIDKKYPELAQKYSDVYLLRNEQFFKLYAFADGRALEPDFVLFLIGKTGKKTKYYQIFIEPKGKHLLLADAWKEDFLKSIKGLAQVEQLTNDKNYSVWGLPFFNESERLTQFEAGFAPFVEESAG